MTTSTRFVESIPVVNVPAGRAVAVAVVRETLTVAPPDAAAVRADAASCALFALTIADPVTAEIGRAVRPNVQRFTSTPTPTPTPMVTERADIAAEVTATEVDALPVTAGARADAVAGTTAVEIAADVVSVAALADAVAGTTATETETLIDTDGARAVDVRSARDAESCCPAEMLGALADAAACAVDTGTVEPSTV